MFLKIGKRYINTDHITDVKDQWRARDTIVVKFVGDGDINLTGDDAAALLKYLDSIAMNLTPETPEDRSWTEYLSKGGTMAREQFEQKVRQLKSFTSRSDNWWSDPQNSKIVSDLEAELLA